VITVGRLKNKQAVRIGALLESLAVAHVGLKLNEVCDTECVHDFLEEVFGAGRAKCNAESARTDFSFLLQARQGLEERTRIALLRINEASVQEAHGLIIGNGLYGTLDEGSEVFFVVAILGPLVMFTPGMARAKRKGLADYGLLAQRYVESFEQKWVLGHPAEQLLGSADIQSLADLGNSYAVVNEMRSIPFGLQDITRLAVATAAPLLPLMLTIFSPEELIMRVIKVVF